MKTSEHQEQVVAHKKKDGYHIEFLSNIPSKKNSKQMICKPYPKLVSSKAHQKWIKECNSCVEAVQKLKNADISNIKTIEVEFYHKLNKDGTEPKKTFDLSNKFESIADWLVDIKFLTDDNYNVLSQVILKFGGFRPEQGADVHLYIEEL